MNKIKILGLFIGLLISNLSKGQILISLLLGDKLNSDKLEFGLDGGLTLSKAQGTGAQEHLRTLNLGFYFDIKIKDKGWMLNTGLRVKSEMGGNKLPVYPTQNATIDSLFSDGYVTRKINYFYLPVLLKYKFKNNFFAEAGIQAGLKHGGSDIFKKKLLDTDDLVYTLNTKDQYKWLDFGLSAGLGYKLMKGKGMNLGARIYYGLVDVNNNSGKPAQNNLAYYINVGIPIGKKPN